MARISAKNSGDRKDPLVYLALPPGNRPLSAGGVSSKKFLCYFC